MTTKTEWDQSYVLTTQGSFSPALNTIMIEEPSFSFHSCFQYSSKELSFRQTSNKSCCKNNLEASFVFLRFSFRSLEQRISLSWLNRQKTCFRCQICNKTNFAYSSLFRDRVKESFGNSRFRGFINSLAMVKDSKLVYSTCKYACCTETRSSLLKTKWLVPKDIFD